MKIAFVDFFVSTFMLFPLIVIFSEKKCKKNFYNNWSAMQQPI